MEINNLLKKIEVQFNDNKDINQITEEIFKNSSPNFTSQKISGSYYTDAKFSNYMAKMAINDYLCFQLRKSPSFPLNNIKIRDKYKEFNDINQIETLSPKFKSLIYEDLVPIVQNLKICDPALGDGIFLQSCANQLIKIYKNILDYFNWNFDRFKNLTNYQHSLNDIQDIKKHIIENNLYGVDIRQFAVNMSKIRLWLWSLKNHYDDRPNKIDYHDFFKLKFNIIRKNSLSAKDNLILGDKNSLIRSWHLQFPSIFQDTNGKNGFDIILGNPPYILMINVSPQEKLCYKEYFSETFHANGDIMYLFFELGLNLLQQDGILCYLTKRYFPRKPTAKNLRKFLSGFHVHKVYDFGENHIFKTAKVDSLIIMVGKKQIWQDSKLEYWIHDKIKNPIDLMPENKTKTRQYFLNQEKLKEVKWIFLENNIWRFPDNAKTLGDICTISKGIQTGKDDVFILSEERAKLHSIPLSNHNLKFFLKSSDIKAFKINSIQKRYLIYSPHQIGESIKNSEKIWLYLLKNKKQLKYGRNLKPRSRTKEVSNSKYKAEWYHWRQGDERITLNWNSPKIVGPYKYKENVYALDEDGFYFSQDVIFIHPKITFEKYLFYILGLLNSPLMTFFVNNFVKELKSGYYEAYPQQISQFPIILPNLTDIEKIDKNIKEIIKNPQNSGKERKSFNEYGKKIYNFLHEV